MNNVNIEAKLNIDIQYGGAKAIVTVNNIGNENIHLFRDNIPLNQKMGKTLFDITSKGRKIKYIGRSVKKRLSIEDFYLLRKGEKIEFSVNLKDFYDFLAGENEYSIQYFVFNPYMNKDGFFVIKSNVVKIDIKK